VKRSNVLRGLRYWLLASTGALAALTSVAAAQIQVLTGLTHVQSAQPGDRISFVSRILNTTNETQRIEFAIADYAIRASEDVFLEGGTTDRSLAPWATVGAPADLPPGETHDVVVTIEVPPDLPRSGSYWALLFITPDVSYPLPVRTQSGDEEDNEASAMRFTYRNRTAVQLILEIPGSERPVMTIERPRLSRDDMGDLSFDVELENTGGRWTNQASMTLDVYDGTTGERVASLTERTGRIYPNSSRRVRFQLGALPERPYQLVAIAEANDAQPTAVRYTIDLGSTSSDEMQRP